LFFLNWLRQLINFTAKAPRYAKVIFDLADIAFLRAFAVKNYLARLTHFELASPID
jgi:hypothetical protein